MKRLIVAVLLFFMCGVAMAAGTKESLTSNLPKISPVYTSNPIPAGDQSMHFLEDLFGNVSDVLKGGGSDLLGQVFKVINYGVLIVAGLWLGYTILNVFLQAATEGGFNSPNKKVMYILLRLALGFALIIPNSTTGYSLSQDIMMKVVVEGVQLADTTWSYALQYLNNGGIIYPEATGLSIYT